MPTQFSRQIQGLLGAGVVESYIGAEAGDKEGTDLSDPLEGSEHEVSQITNDEVARLGHLQDIRGGRLIVTGKP